MAITTNHTIDTTLRKAIDYILNPDKTDAKLLVHAYACTPEIADIEFDCTREHAYNKGEHLARHIIQAFSPGETTPEQAHEIGKRFADELLGGKFEYILTTHIDKGHIHNHIICNDVSFVDYKHIHINEKWYNHSRRINDRLCKEYGLSVVEPNAERKNKNTKYENKPTCSHWMLSLHHSSSFPFSCMFIMSSCVPDKTTRTTRTWSCVIFRLMPAVFSLWAIASSLP